MEWLLGMAAVIAGIAIGSIAAILWGFSKRNALHIGLSNAQARADLSQAQLQQAICQLTSVRDELGRCERDRETAEKQVAVLIEKNRVLEEAEKRLTATFESTSAKALHASSEQFLKLAEQRLAPFKDLLDKQNKAVGELEQKREKAYGSLEQQIRQIAASHERLSGETGKLVKALRRPEQRGRWGEMALRNAVELAGMTAHCDFDEQVTIWLGESALRPDMVINMPQRGAVPVDAKVAIDAYLDAIDCEDGAESKADCLRRHAEQIERHVKSLAAKRYWDGFDQTRAPQLVVMFMPLESALVAALETKPDLHHAAMQQKVLIATPTLLVALLRAVAYGWQQDALARNSREIAAAGKELYDRLATFVGHFERVGSALGKSVDAYNSAVGSLERSLLPGARKLKELHATTDGDVPTPELVEVEVRPVVSAELKPNLFETTAKPEIADASV